MTMSASAARVEYSARPTRASSTWKATLASASAAAITATLDVSPIPAGDHFHCDHPGEHDQEGAVD